MQPANLISSLQTLNRTDKPLITADTPTSPVSKTDGVRESPLQPGQRIQGTVQAQVSPGLYKVQVNGQSLQMQLPGQLKNGSVLELQVMSTSPRLTFSLSASNSPIATQEQISSTSRLLANLADLPLTRTLITSNSSKPILQPTGAAINSQQLASGLRDALANSGLFYESHQAQWISGERSTAQLLVEPQNQWQNQDKLTQLNQAAIPPDKVPNDSSSPIAKELVSLVQQQLHTLENHQLTWTGQVWPGQQMQWEIEGQPEHQTGQMDERQWSTEMELALPKLGDVHARLVFNQHGVKLNLQAADASSVALLHRKLPSLASTLAEAGIPLTSSVIEKT